ncbi:MAG: hypothetical protein A2Z31_07415 [candidate division NC10 bacterium RBG_16_65_8]|nr:MAG: hypothetical protein A2Z31_07415 [candidate division NC10 bacterium RBG_16_65_8]
MATDRTTSGPGGKPTSGKRANTAAQRILLVGDKPVFAALRQGLLRAGESKVLGAASGGEGLRVALTALPELILLDADLPDMDGVEVCRRLRSDPLTEAIPVILLVNGSKPQQSQGTLEASPVASVPIGIDTARLLNMIQMILTMRLSRRTAARAPVTLGVDYISADRAGTGKTLNLSQDGMFIVTPQPPDVNTHVILHFALPDSEPLEATAKVVWVRTPEKEHPYPAGMAVQFLKLPPEAQPAIAAFVAGLLGNPAPSQEA